MKKDHWKVIYTGSRQEKKLAAALQDAGIEVFLPLFRSLRQWSDRKKWVDLPLFNGYLFVRPGNDRRDEVLTFKGAISYLRFNKKDALVTENEIGVIKNILASGYSMQSISTPSDFNAGDKAVVLEGPLKGQTIDVIRRNKKDLFLVSFDTLGQSIKISLPYQILKKLV